MTEVENILDTAGISMMASSITGSNMKFFLYAQEAGTMSIFLIEANVDTAEGVLSASFKTKSPERASEFAFMFRRALSGQ